jgi:putative transcriptional regulator
MLMVRATLRELLEQRDISLNELARQSGVTYPTLLSLYHGKSGGVTFAVLDALCRALDCEPGDLLEYVPKGRRRAG